MIYSSINSTDQIILYKHSVILESLSTKRKLPCHYHAICDNVFASSRCIFTLSEQIRATLVTAPMATGTGDAARGAGDTWRTNKYK